MKKIPLALSIMCISITLCCTSSEEYIHGEDSQFYESALKPFYHGVASGDPLPDRIIIWTRVTPDYDRDVIVGWEVSTDSLFENIVKLGKSKAISKNDFCLKLDVTGLQPDTRYFYRFKALGETSITGKTRTGPEDDVDSLRFVLATCSNYEHGYFNAYARIAERHDLSAVIHVGDYIYEYASRKYGSSTLDTTYGRFVIPDKELLILEDYRLRYSQYRLDKDLRRAHQNHPFIVVWDDHEIANDCYVHGAQNHQPEFEGDWHARKKAARKAYFEWMPIRGEKVYRRFSFGSLADLIMVDERLEGRTKQLSMSDPHLYDSTRTILGKKQYDWFTHNLLNSQAKWKLFGSQVIFGEWNVQKEHRGMPKFSDKWAGYPFERDKILSLLKEKKIDNTIILSGDFHCSMAFDVTDAPLRKKSSDDVDLMVLAVEAVTPSITAANYDFSLPIDSVRAIENMYMNDPENAHLKFVDLANHGYLLITLTSDETRFGWYFMDRIDRESKNEYLAKSLYVKDKSNRLMERKDKDSIIIN